VDVATTVVDLNSKSDVEIAAIVEATKAATLEAVVVLLEVAGVEETAILITK
jgi:hypothetical protein